MKYHSFKTISVTLILFLSLVLTSCFQEPDGIGFLSDEIYLKGSDTLYIELGGKGHSNYAWLDASSQPVKFSIENIRNEAGERSEQFFQKYTYRVWQKPYDFLKDKTLEDLIAKLTDIEMSLLSLTQQMVNCFILKLHLNPLRQKEASIMWMYELQILKDRR